MSPPADLLDRALSLSPEERAEFARRLLLSLEGLPAEPQDEVERAWAAEVEARLVRADADPGSERDWRESVARVRNSLRGG